VRRSIISARDQRGRVMAMYPQFRTRMIEAVRTIEGRLMPTARSEEYQFRIEYEALEPPRVWILKPALRPREPGGRMPHMYDQERLCLYLPNGGEWSGDMSLANTLIPWVSEWLFYYETWHATGEWLGGGTEPFATRTLRKEKDKEDHDRE
jgi:hypothetical protein